MLSRKQTIEQMNIGTKLLLQNAKLTGLVNIQGSHGCAYSGGIYILRIGHWPTKTAKNVLIVGLLRHEYTATIGAKCLGQ
ncbi:hypothetical protein D3C86_1745590 [compost metagenome]